jgi:Glycosyl hydrolase family 71
VVKTGRCLVVFICSLGLAVYGFASQTVNPNTTLSLETGNNTSTPDGFRAQTNGNTGAGNVSKVGTRELLYDKASTQIYAHYMPWFGTSSHMNVGYSTTDPVQVARQVDDMVSRGIQGVIIDWYGPNNSHTDLSTLTMMKAVEKHSGFKFAIMEDAGALKNATDKTATLISDLIYAWQTYEQSPAYMTVNNRPVVFFFGVELLTIDWNAVRSQAPGNPLFVFQNSGSFKNQFADAGFSWVGYSGDPNDWGQSYLNDFYNTGLASNKHIVGSVKKGFNDTLASWGKNRIVNQNCGQTWLSTFAEIGKHFSATKQLEFLQLVTWNDYEEGTALEMGIDNCVTVDGSISGSKLTWNITGQENTIHHYTIFVSVDGERLMSVADAPAGTRELDLSSFDFQAGSYTVYVKAVGQPSIRNKMSGPIGYNVVASSGNAADLALSATPNLIALAVGGSGSADVVLIPTGDFNRAVTLSCLNLPAAFSCSFDKQSLTPGTSVASAKLTVRHTQVASTGSNRAHLLLALYLPGLGLGMVVLGGTGAKRRKTLLLLVVALVALCMAAGCTGLTKTAPQQEQSQPPASQSGSYQFTIVAQASDFQRSISATINVK